MAGKFASLFSKTDTEKKIEQTVQPTIEVIEQTTAPEIIDVQKTITKTAKESMELLNYAKDAAMKVISTPIKTESVKIESNVNEEFEYEDVDVINLTNICQSFKTDNGEFKLFDNFNLDIKDFKGVGQFVSIMGASGCGKSTIMKYIAGLNKPDSGSIKIYGKEQTDKDSIPMVFQQYSSFPFYNVLFNVALPKIINGVDKKTAFELAYEKLKLVGLEDHATKYPNKLSGGQQQRVAIARALNCDSKLLILDEYSSGLDMFTKFELQDLLMKLFNDPIVDRTFLLVTHDVSEAVFLSNRIYVLGTNPCHINEIIDVNLGNYRDRDIRKTKEFEEYHLRVVNAFNK